MNEDKKTRFGMSPEKALEVFNSSHASKLKNIRAQKGFSQQDLADLSGVAKRLIQTYEQGSRNIDNAQLETLCKLAKGIGCKIEDILESEELVKLYKDVK